MVANSNTQTQKQLRSRGSARCIRLDARSRRRFKSQNLRLGTVWEPQKFSSAQNKAKLARSIPPDWMGGHSKYATRLELMQRSRKMRRWRHETPRNRWKSTRMKEREQVNALKRLDHAVKKATKTLRRPSAFASIYERSGLKPWVLNSQHPCATVASKIYP